MAIKHHENVALRQLDYANLTIIVLRTAFSGKTIPRTRKIAINL